MISFFGHLALFAAIFFSLTQSLLPFLGYKFNNPYLLAFARPSVLGQFFFLLMAYLLLTTAFITNDFTLQYVALNSHPLLPIIYKFGAVWGAHEGSILLFIFLLSAWTFLFSFYKNQALSIAILGLMSACLIAFLLFTSDPFSSSIGIQTGFDLNPLLQDPGFIIHPPILYTGYVGFSVVFAITLAALIENKNETEWLSKTRYFALASWSFLTLGITLGSWWAYRVLGWGGFWFWDPVENASLLPWLSGLALIHVLVLAEKRKKALKWGAFLALLTFALSLFGTFLVRSGLLISAHTFANDPKRGLFLLLIIAFLLSAGLTVYIMRLSKITIKATGSSILYFRELALLLNSACSILAMLTVLLATLYPILLDAFHLGAISIGPPYFNLVMTPLTLLTLGLMGFAPFCRFELQKLSHLFKKVYLKIFISLFLAFIITFYAMSNTHFLIFLILAVILFVSFSIVNSIQTFPGMAIAHLGFSILILGVLLSSILKEESQIRLHPGQMTKLGPYQFFFVDTKAVTGSNYRGIRAQFDVMKNNHFITRLEPEKRIYFVRDMVMSKVDIHPSIFRDLYIALGEPLNDQDWSLRIYYKPFVRFVWLGGILMMVGGILALFKKKKI